MTGNHDEEVWRNRIRPSQRQLDLDYKAAVAGEPTRYVKKWPKCSSRIVEEGVVRWECDGVAVEQKSWHDHPDSPLQPEECVCAMHAENSQWMPPVGQIVWKTYTPTQKAAFEAEAETRKQQAEQQAPDVSPGLRKQLQSSEDYISKLQAENRRLRGDN